MLREFVGPYIPPQGGRIPTFFPADQPWMILTSPDGYYVHLVRSALRLVDSLFQSSPFEIQVSCAHLAGWLYVMAPLCELSSCNRNSITRSG